MTHRWSVWPDFAIRDPASGTRRRRNGDRSTVYINLCSPFLWRGGGRPERTQLARARGGSVINAVCLHPYPAPIQSILYPGYRPNISQQRSERHVSPILHGTRFIGLSVCGSRKSSQKPQWENGAAVRAPGLIPHAVSLWGIAGTVQIPENVRAPLQWNKSERWSLWAMHEVHLHFWHFGGPTAAPARAG